MKKIQCSCGKFYESNMASCPHCGEARSFYSGAEEGMKPISAVPTSILVIALLNLFPGSVFGLMFWVFTVIYVLIALAMFVSSIVWMTERVKRKGIAIATNIIAGGELIVGAIYLVVMLSLVF